MSDLITNYSNNARDGFIAAIRQEVTSNPSGAMADLAKIVGADFEVLSDVSMAELFPPRATSTIAATPKPKANRKPRSSGGGAAGSKPSSPSPAAGDSSSGTELEQEVFNAIALALESEGKHEVDNDGGAWVRAATIRDLVGGDLKASKLRVVLGKLIESGRIVFMGKAAGTKYTIAKN